MNFFLKKQVINISFSKNAIKSNSQAFKLYSIRNRLFSGWKFLGKFHQRVKETQFQSEY